MNAAKPASVPSLLGFGSGASSTGELPRRFGAYTLFEQIGRGGMAQLFLARAETELGATRLAVVKQILPAFSADPRFAEMLIHEAKLAASLSHRHIVQVFDLGRAEGQLYIAMEYVEGIDLNFLLRHCVDRQALVPTGHAIGIVVDVLEGLEHAHRRRDDAGAPLGLIHRDVSPSNVLISYEGEVKLCDFGIAHANDLVDPDVSDALKGKAGYMSPEHAAGEALDARADVFAAGIVLWELLSGRRLYRPRESTPLLEQARRAEVPPLVDRGQPSHPRLAAIVARALAKRREDRYASAADFANALHEYLASVGFVESRLKLGDWIARTLGTEPLERRRAAEGRLPKSTPPPRPSGFVRVAPPATLEPEDPAPLGITVPLFMGALLPARLPSVRPGGEPRSPSAPDEGPSGPIAIASPPPPSTDAPRALDLPAPPRIGPPASLDAATLDLDRASDTDPPRAVEERAGRRRRVAAAAAAIAIGIGALLAYLATR